MFDSWRDGQAELLDVIITSEKRCKVGCAPTGFGKSPVNVAAALVTHRPTCIVTPTKALQSQYMDDFSSIGMVSLMGRQNYQCGLREDYTCEDGHVAQCPNRGTIMCPSSQAEMAAAASSLVVTNYSKWCASRRYGTGMQHFTQVVFDEGDEGPDAIASAMQVVLNQKEIEQDLELGFPEQHECDQMPIWKLWAKHASTVAEDAMQKALARITGVSKPKPSHVRKYTHMRNLWRRLAIVKSCKPDDWVVDEIKDGYQFDPIRIGRYAESALLLHVPHIIFTSATIRPKTMFMMGIAQRDFEFREFPSDFPPERWPIYYSPTMRVDKRAEDWSMLWLKHDQVAAPRQDRNGTVHCVSYGKGKELKAASRFGDRMILNEQGKPLHTAIEQFFGTYPGAILVSPSIERGYDLKFKKSEWQFMTKIPFEPPSKILKAREADDREYRAYQAIRRIGQAIGRGMRDRRDQCEFVIGDQHMDWFWPRYSYLGPKHIRVQTVHQVPPPPPRLP